MNQKIALVNDYKTRIPKTRTFWHFLEENLNAKFFSNKKWFWKRSLKKYNPHIVIQNAFWGDLGLKQGPIIMLIQDNYPALMENGFLESSVCTTHINQIKSAVDIADHVVVNVKSLIKRYNISPKKASFIPMGIDDAIFYPSTKERIKTRKELGIVGHCSVFVGDETSIHGWNEVKQKIEDDTNETWILVSKNKPFSLKRKNIISFCNIDHDRLRALYNASDMFFARGSIGLPAIEAMLSGVKIDVSHDIGYFEDWYPNNVNPRADAIASGFVLKDTIREWDILVTKMIHSYYGTGKAS